MKLILKRVPYDATVTIDSSVNLTSRSKKSKNRPFALFTEDGVMLPLQVSVLTESLPGQCPKATVTFLLDGEDVKVQGDD